MFDHVVNLYVPEAILDIARCVNRSLDKDDVGGAGAFQRKVLKGAEVWYTYSRPCSAEYAQSISMLLLVRDELFKLCAVDYASRWPELECPTYSEIVKFCELCECYVDSIALDFSDPEPEQSPFVTQSSSE